MTIIPIIKPYYRIRAVSAQAQAEIVENCDKCKPHEQWHKYKNSALTGQTQRAHFLIGLNVNE